MRLISMKIKKEPKKHVHCKECNDLNYVHPSQKTLDILHKSIENVKSGGVIIYHLDNFKKYADDI